MSVLSMLAARNTTLTPAEVDYLHRLLGEWQVLADLSFADCSLFVRVTDGERFLICGQVRPYPAQTLYEEDLVGTLVEVRARPRVAIAFAEERIVREGDPEWRDGVPIREDAIPVMFGGRAIAVVSVEQNLASARTPSRLELAYLRAAANLERMIVEGSFPFVVEEQSERELTPRVGDGFIEVDDAWTITYASPNAVSAYRRLGIARNIQGVHLQDLEIDHQHLLATLRENLPIEDEVEAGGAWVLRRFLPVRHGGRQHGAIGLVRDITESRVRDRMLSIKDTTIREIHHRVKNNLQTVASLLRLQARRLGPGEARAELEESVRRIASIAIVHEALSQQTTERVAFDTIAQRVLEMARDSLVRPDRPVRFTMQGSAGELVSEIATPLSLVLTELLQNAVEHAFPARGGAVTVQMHREPQAVRLIVTDDGVGLPPDFSLEGTSSLGLQIVRTLVADLGGSIEMRTDGGACAEIVIPVR